MAARRPMVLEGGRASLMPAGDSIPVSAGGTGATTAVQAQVNLGINPGRNPGPGLLGNGGPGRPTEFNLLNMTEVAALIGAPKEKRYQFNLFVSGQFVYMHFVERFWLRMTKTGTTTFQVAMSSSDSSSCDVRSVAVNANTTTGVGFDNSVFESRLWTNITGNVGAVANGTLDIWIRTAWGAVATAKFMTAMGAARSDVIITECVAPPLPANNLTPF